MKVGDLVEPSAKIIKGAGFMWLQPESIGLVVREPNTEYFTWQVMWHDADQPSVTRRWNMRREWIKHAKVKK